MTKYWQPGTVKTRLAVSVGDAAAASLHQSFVACLLRRLDGCASRCQWTVSPADRLPELSDWLTTHQLAGSWELADQGGGDLGERIQRWFRSALSDAPQSANGSSPAQSTAVLIGGDCPTLTASEIACAVTGLVDHDIVAGPAVDGGYYLIGLRGPWVPSYENLFSDIPWSTSDVMAVTARRAAASQLTLRTLPKREDIDTIDELNRLRKHLAQTVSPSRSPPVSPNAGPAIVDMAMDGWLRERIEQILSGSDSAE
ncbi:MAG: TIGR04282 family arsenosugar biosynthesis glycosyltransferase [Planctomycetota bacterium]